MWWIPRRARPRARRALRPSARCVAAAAAAARLAAGLPALMPAPPAIIPAPASVCILLFTGCTVWQHGITRFMAAGPPCLPPARRHWPPLPSTHRRPLDCSDLQERAKAFSSYKDYLGKDITSLVILPVWIMQPFTMLQVGAGAGGGAGACTRSLWLPAVMQGWARARNCTILCS